MDLNNVQVSFEQLGLSSPLLENIASLGYEHPTQIQAESIPRILEGKDILGGAHTGTGKTAAFMLPILELLKRSGEAQALPRVLILTPTRELAIQVEQSACELKTGLAFRAAAVYGGVKMRVQTAVFEAGVDIIIATPGRLLDHLRQGNINLGNVQILVFDEADRMLDMGFIHDMNKIVAELPEQRQTLLFSATASGKVKRLIHEMLSCPTEHIEVTPPNSAAKKIRQNVIMIPRACKADLLAHIIKQENYNQVLVFTRSKKAADELTATLTSAGISAAAIHKDKEQSERTQVLDDFRSGVIKVLTATDIAARGLDIDNMPCVVNYELPERPEVYIHRIGRTGRAGRQGQAFSLVSPDEMKLLDKIEKLLKWNIKRVVIRDYTPPKSSGGMSRKRAKTLKSTRHS
jgi:ATP-dependent RNA helicase RhlE